MKFKHLSLIFCLFYHFYLLNAQISVSDLGIDGDIDNDPIAIKNKSYSDDETELHKMLFRGYDRSLRPKRDQLQPIYVSVHLHLTHLSVQEKIQSVRLYGHIYMSWYDEFLVWDPSNFNNLRTMSINQWEVWQPDFKIANSVSGVGQYFDISKRSHASLTSIDPNRTKIEIYPTFAISVGCDFDFTDFPFDEQTCALRFYTTASMKEVELNLYYNLNPSVVLAWDEDSNKRHVSNWELLNLAANMTYFRWREYTESRPTEAYKLMSTWSIILCTLFLKRNPLHYWFTLALPGFSTMFINIMSFAVYRIETAIFMLIFNLFLQIILMHDCLEELPPSVERKPNIIIFSALLLTLTVFAIAMHICLKLANERKWQIPAQVLKYTDILHEKTKKALETTIGWLNSHCIFTIDLNENESIQVNEIERVVFVKDVLRKGCLIFYIILFFPMSLLLVSRRFF